MHCYAFSFYSYNIQLDDSEPPVKIKTQDIHINRILIECNRITIIELIERNQIPIELQSNNIEINRTFIEAIELIQLYIRKPIKRLDSIKFD